MKKGHTTESHLGLRELIKENETQVCQFLYYMLFGVPSIDATAIQIFREFGDFFRRQTKKKNSDWQKAHLRIQLYTIAWKHILKTLGQIEYSWALGRDTRPLKMLDADLLTLWSRKRVSPEEVEQFLPRLSRIDVDFRAPLILRDILSFEDEEILRILGIRWGVYRHRLHRGRLAFREVLKGKQAKDAEERALAPTPAY